MNSRIIKGRERERVQQRVDRGNGYGASVIKLSSHRAITANVFSVGHLGCTPTPDVTLQDSSGNFYFLAGYSQVGGPDL